MTETRRGTCPWCEKEDRELGFVVWYWNEKVITEWICASCRRENRTPTVNENED